MNIKVFLLSKYSNFYSTLKSQFNLPYLDMLQIRKTSRQAVQYYFIQDSFFTKYYAHRM